MASPFFLFSALRKCREQEKGAGHARLDWRHGTDCHHLLYSKTIQWMRWKLSSTLLRTAMILYTVHTRIKVLIQATPTGNHEHLAVDLRRPCITTKLLYYTYNMNLYFFLFFNRYVHTSTYSGPIYPTMFVPHKMC